MDQLYKNALSKIGEFKVPTSIEVKQAADPNGLNFIDVSVESTQLKDLFQKIRVKKQDNIGATTRCEITWNT